MRFYRFVACFPILLKLLFFGLGWFSLVGCKLSGYSFTLDEAPEQDCLEDRNLASFDWTDQDFKNQIIANCSTFELEKHQIIKISQSQVSGALFHVELGGSKTGSWHVSFPELHRLSINPPKFSQVLADNGGIEPKSRDRAFHLELVFETFGKSCERMVARVYRLKSIDAPLEEAEDMRAGVCPHNF